MVGIHVVLTAGHVQVWIGHEAASIRRNLLEFSAQTGNRERNKSRQLIGVHEEHFEVGQVAQLRRDRAAELIPPEAEGSEGGQVPEFRWDRSSQVVPGQD